MEFSKTQLIILGVAGLIVLFFLLAFLGLIPGARETAGKIKLEMWGVGDSARVWETSIASFRRLHPAVSISYTSVPEADYERKLIDALAAGRGPDILMFHSTWLPKHGNKIVPAGDQISLTVFERIYPDVAKADFTFQGGIYSLPLSIDTLGLFYNKDIFNNKRIPVPPATWDEFKSAILKIREFKSGDISKAGAAIGGTSKSVLNAPDLVSLLMLQFKSPMAGGEGHVNLNNQNGRAALDFYTQFASPKSSYYTWKDSFANSIDSFSQGKAAMIFAYASQLPQIRSKSPFMNLGVTSVPQFNKSEAVNFPSYWGLSVSVRTPYSKEAWDFVSHAATNEEVASNYLRETKKPPALRTLIQRYIDDSELGVFAGQALTAKSWRQIDKARIDKIFDTMIEAVLTDRFRSDQALDEAETSINNLNR